MAIEGVPWMVAGGKHSAEVGRSLAYAATSGATGVVLPGDLKVTALPTPGAGVRIAAGSASVVSSFPGASGQSYIVRGVGSTDIDVAKAGTTAATRYVILRVSDPAYPQQPAPANPADGPYVFPEVVSSIDSLNFPFIPLAKIAIPANTATITQALITDLRVIANPRQMSYVEMGIPPAGEAMTSSGGKAYPSYRPNILVPAWATEVAITTTISSIASTGNTHGEMATTLGNGGENQFRSANTVYDVDTQGEQRHSFTIGGKGLVPAALRGTVQPLGTEFRRVDGPGSLITRRGTHVVYQVNFSESVV